MAFSSLYEERCPFTRDYNVIKGELKNIEDYDKTCIETAFHGVSQMVLGEWGNNTACQVNILLNSRHILSDVDNQQTGKMAKLQL